jgi:SRSO17 transposase
MDLKARKEIAVRFNAYVGALTETIGHADRNEPLRDYCSGLLATEGRRSVEPMVAVTDPGHVSAQHQKLLHFVANSPWSDEEVLATSARTCGAVDDAACPDPSVDHRRYSIS